MIALKKLREEKRMTQAELSKALEISPSAIGMYEQGRRVPDVSTLKKYLHTLMCLLTIC